jgi:hypothetical protein
MSPSRATAAPPFVAELISNTLTLWSTLYGVQPRRDYLFRIRYINFAEIFRSSTAFRAIVRSIFQLLTERPSHATARDCDESRAIADLPAYCTINEQMTPIRGVRLSGHVLADQNVLKILC